ncbi:TetR/AcrR family transcriptional regulator [Saccharopolyspora sp. ASAGF58]|uniref:TetR/AcrR family transcriptional regulator n=1 Tax=Saccharopolyspora sp. ASAGF58 TaxID=2719023 RepID=UPI00143FECE3|nr:TetR/AcrR family transcriptional regulator [Saccharopolyspora sp. ASAGF58]QIZ38008.1 helix-turn-helix transcriptional regulator [Saccharopolyspora sp. ASAGF58]
MTRSRAETATNHAGDRNWRSFEPLGLSPILTAALEVFQEHGFHGASVREIARRVGQTVPALYYHHENKEAILVALLEVGTEDVAWRVRAASAEAPGRPDLQFVYVVQAIVLHVTRRLRLAQVDTELRYLSPPKRRRYATRRKAVENALADIVVDGLKQDMFAAVDPAETARALLGMCQSISRWYLPDGPLTPEQIADRYVDIALMTVGISERPRDAPPLRKAA